MIAFPKNTNDALIKEKLQNDVFFDGFNNFLVGRVNRVLFLPLSLSLTNSIISVLKFLAGCVYTGFSFQEFSAACGLHTTWGQPQNLPLFELA